MQVGTVKWYDYKKGFGFILSPEGQNVLVHFTAIEGQKDSTAFILANKSHSKLPAVPRVFRPPWCAASTILRPARSVNARSKRPFCIVKMPSTVTGRLKTSQWFHVVIQSMNDSHQVFSVKFVML
jgi:hypothetical protein